MKKNKTMLLLFGLVIFIALIALIFITYFKGRIPSNIFSFVDIGTFMMPKSSIEVNSLNSYGQSFTSNFDNLFMMSIFIPRQSFAKGGELLFRLKRNKADGKDLATLNWKFDQIKFKENSFYVIPPDRESTVDGFHFHFQFPVIHDSKGREFYFSFECPSGPGQGLRLGVWRNLKYYESLSKGKMFLNGEAEDGFLAFRTYNTWEGNAADIFLAILRRLKRDIAFIFFYAIVFLVVICALCVCSLARTDIENIATRT